MTDDSELLLILTALFMEEVKVKYDLGLVNNSNLQYSGRLVGMISRAPKYIQGNSRQDINYPLGAVKGRGGFRR